MNYIVRRTFHDLYCLYSLSQAILKLIKSKCPRTHFVTLIEIGLTVYLITGNPGHIGNMDSVTLYHPLVR